MVLGQHRRMWLEAMRQTEQRVYGFGSLKDGYALVGIHLRKQKCCLKKGTTSVFALKNAEHIDMSPTLDALSEFSGFGIPASVRSNAKIDNGRFCLLP